MVLGVEEAVIRKDFCYYYIDEIPKILDTVHIRNDRFCN